MIDLTPKYNLLPAKDKLVFPEGELAEVSGGWAFGATEQQKGGNVLDANLRVVPPGGNIQKAIDELNAIGAGTVLLQRGTHILTQTLTGYSKVSIIGEGRDQTIIECGGNAYGITYAGVAGTIKNDFSLKDFTIQNSNNAAGIDIDFCDYWNMYGVVITECDQKGLRIDHSQKFNITSVHALSNTGNGIEIKGDTATRNTISSIFLDCDIEVNAIGLSLVDTGGSGIRDIKFINCRAIDNLGDGFDFTQTFGIVSRLEIIGCTAVTNLGKGFDLNIQGIGICACEAISNTGDGFEISNVAWRMTGCWSGSNGGSEYDILGSGTFVGNGLVFGTSTNPSTQITIPSELFNFYSVGNQAMTFKQQFVNFRMKNTSGGTLAIGDVVILKSVAGGDEITTTTTQGDDKVFGIVVDTSLSNNSWGGIVAQGFTAALKVDGTTDIAIGDLLGTFTSAGIAMKASAGDMCFAIALEAYTTNDSLGVIDALIVNPRTI